MAVSELEEGYIRPLVRGLIEKYENLGRNLQELVEPAEELQDRISKLVQVLNSSRHQLGGITHEIIPKIDGLKNKINRMLEKAKQAEVEDLSGMEKFLEDFKTDIKDSLKTVEDLEKILREPIHAYIASMISEYVGLDQKSVLRVLEEFGEEEILSLKSEIKDLINMVSTNNYSDLKEDVRSIFSSEAIQTDLNKEIVRGVIECAYSTYEVLGECKNKHGVPTKDIAKMFLSRLNNYQALLDLKSRAHEIIEGASSLTTGINKLSEITSINTKGKDLVSVLSELIKTVRFANLDDVVTRLRTVSKAVENLIKSWKNYQILDSILNQAKNEYNRLKDSLMIYYKKEYENYLNKLNNLKNLCEKDISNNICEILKELCRSGFYTFKCPEKVCSKLLDELQNSIKDLLRVLRGTKVIIEELCKESSELNKLNKRLKEINNDLEKMLKEPNKILEYHKYIIEANDVSNQAISCISRGSNRNRLEVDVTDLNPEIVKALIDVLKASGKRLVLRAVQV